MKSTAKTTTTATATTRCKMPTTASKGLTRVRPFLPSLLVGSRESLSVISVGLSRRLAVLPAEYFDDHEYDDSIGSDGRDGEFMETDEEQEQQECEEDRQRAQPRVPSGRGAGAAAGGAAARAGARASDVRDEAGGDDDDGFYGEERDGYSDGEAAAAGEEDGAGENREGDGAGASRRFRGVTFNRAKGTYIAHFWNRNTNECVRQL
jgi:hypothetical protein